MDIRTRGNRIANAIGNCISLLIGITLICLALAVPVGVIVVAIHFIGKYW